MVSQDQAQTIAWLADPATHGGAPVERIDTHSAIVFLAGTRALKLKRAVRFDYLDFSTIERRRRMCDAEVRLNRRTAPGLYRGTAAVTRDRAGRLAFDGPGSPVDWLVVMTRFDEARLFDRLAERDALDREICERLAEAIARFHRDAAPRPDHGGRAAMQWVVDGNAAGFAQFAPFLDQATTRGVTARASAAVDRAGAALDRRRDHGWVRQCHGDLHLRNIVEWQGEPTLFDAIEFNDALACVDVMYDLAFLLMDLWRRGLHDQANAVLNRYLAVSGDEDGVALLGLFLSCRAAIRAKTHATAAQLGGLPDAAALRRAAAEYLRLADRLLDPARPRLLAIGGFSGTGKSTLARRLAPSLGAVPGAVILRSDEVRKGLCGVGRDQRLAADGYAEDMSARVYRTLEARAGRLLGHGHSVIADAVYAREDDRRAIERVAAGAGAAFDAVWLEAPLEVRLGRVRSRHGDASDADEAVVRRQAAAGAGPIDWPRLDAAPGPDAVGAAAAALLASGCRAPCPAARQAAT